VVPKTVAEDLDRSCGATHWIEAINLEAKHVDVAFQEIEDYEQVLVVYQIVKWYMIFNVKAGRFKKKPQYVACGQLR
jgi:hypothetical protein